MRWKRNTLISLLAISVALAGLAGTVAAQTSSSSNYSVDEVFFGTGGELNACSSNYCAKQSAGETAVGRTASTSYEAQAGFNTTDEPLLEVAVNGNVDFGNLSTTTTAKGSINTQVRAYLANGYTLALTGTAPHTLTDSLDSPIVAAASQPGTEQFGINLRANSNPSVGLDPEQVPNNTFSFGIPSANYNTPDVFAYQNGDIVAYSNSSSGQTNYTISMIANASNITPAGAYKASLSVVVTAVF